MRLRVPGTINSAIETLEQLKHDCQNSIAGTSDVHDARDRYLVWVDRAHSQLSSLFQDDDLAEGLHSVLYWQIFRIHEGWTRPWDLLRREARSQCERLQRVADALLAHKRFVDHEGRILIPDTSALVKGEFFEELDWAKEFQLGSHLRIVIPILVIEELDSLKDREGKGKVGDRARRVLRRMLELSRDVQPGMPVAIPKRKNATFEVFFDEDWRERMPNNDSEIIDQALLIKELTGQDVALVSEDAAMEFRAKRHGLTTFTIPTPDEVRARA